MQNKFTRLLINAFSPELPQVEGRLTRKNGQRSIFSRGLLFVLTIMAIQIASAQSANTPVLCGGVNPICASSGQSATLCVPNNNYVYNGVNPSSTSYTWQYSNDNVNWVNAGSNSTSITTGSPLYYRYVVNASYQMPYTAYRTEYYECGYYYDCGYYYECGYYYDCGYYYSCGFLGNSRCYQSQTCYQSRTCYYSQTCYQSRTCSRQVAYTDYQNMQQTYYSPSYKVNALTSNVSGISSNKGNSTCVTAGQPNQVVFTAGTGTYTNISWTVPAWMTIVAGQGTPQLTVNINANAVTTSLAGNVLATAINSGCTGNTVGLTFQANAGPVVSISPSSANACPGTTVNLTANASTGGTITNYQWIIDNVNVPGNTSTYTASATGKYAVTVTNSANCSTTSNPISVSFDDHTAPVPDMAQLPVITGECSATAVTAPTATDNCAGTITGTTTGPVTFNSQGSYTITWTFDDGHGNVVTQDQTVIVKDVTAPVPDAAQLPVITGECSATAVTAPTASDNCAGSITGTTTDPVSFSSQGTYTINWIFDDGNGNVSTQQQTVVVKDVTAPVPDMAQLPVITGECAAAVVTAPTASDNCSGTITGTTTDPVSFSSQGTYTINWIYDDGNGNFTRQQQTVVVKDVTAPVPDVAQLPVIRGECSAAAVTAPTATDNCSGTITGTTADPVSFSSQGSYTINWTFDDGNGNVTTQQQTVVVKDVTAPVPDMAQLPVITGECAAAAVTAPTATDNCAGTITGTTSDAVSFSSQGTYTINWIYNDGNGNVTRQQQTVVVKDVTAPVPDVAQLPVARGECSAAATAPTATDNCAGTITGTTSDPVSFSAQGTYTIKWIYNDGNGNISSQLQTVVVKDVTAPVPDVAQLPAVTGECSATATAPTASDNCVGTITGTTSDPVSFSAQGTYTIKWIYNDGNGNTSSQLQTVVVRDVTPPVINCPADITVLATSAAGATVTYTAPVGTDNCVGATTALTAGPASGSVFPIGTTVVTHTVTDGAGLTANCSFKVTVSGLPPVIACPANIVVSNAPGVCGANVNFKATETTGIPASTITYSIASGSYFAVGTTTVTATATNAVGSSSCTFTVTVVDNTAPVIVSCAPSVVTCDDSHGNNRTLSVSATDNCGPVTVTYTITNPAGGTSTGSGSTLSAGFGVGTTKINWVVKDLAGNTSNCSTTVTINALPSFTVSSVPASNVYTGGSSTNLYLGYGAQSTQLQTTLGAGYTYSWSGNNGTGTLSSSTVASPVFTPTVAGNYTFTVTATSSTGCSSKSSISICVSDIRVPGTNGSKVYVCHAPPGNPGNTQTLSISVNAVSSHIGNHPGDKLGSCDQAGCVTNALTSTSVNSAVATKELLTVHTSEEELKVTVMPNPSRTHFTLKLESRLQTPVSLRVMDSHGRVMDTKSKLGANSTVQVGHNYLSGVYFAELIQGNTRKVVQLIKGN